MAKLSITRFVRQWSVERKLSALFLLTMFTWWCYNIIQDSEWSRFRRATEMDRIPVWKAFLDNADDSDRVLFARKRIAHLEEAQLWRKARFAGSPELLQTYIKAYPSGEFHEQADSLFKEMARKKWATIRREPTSSGLRSFVDVYGSSPEADSAKTLYADLAEIAFEEIAKSELEAELDMFSDTWAGTDAAHKAQKRKHDLWNSFTWVKRADTKASYARFIKNNPNSPDATYCKRRLIDIEVDEAQSERKDLGQLPPMSRLRGGSTNRTSIEVKNDTRYTLDVLYSGPSSDRLTITPNSVSSVTLSNGRYRVLASVRTSNVRKYYGEEALSGGEYRVTYYIVSN